MSEPGAINARPPWYILAPAALAAILFIAWIVVWNRGASEMRRAIAAWADDQRTAGLEVEYRAVKTTGFPLFLRGVVAEARISDGRSFSWDAPAFFIDADPLAPGRLVLSAREPHVLDLGRAGRWRIDAPDGRASLARDATRNWTLDVEAGNGRLTRLDKAGSVSAGSFLLSVAPNAIEGDRIFFAILARDVAAGAEGNAAFVASDIEIAFAVSAAAAAFRGLEAWRAEGGTIEIQRAAIASGGARASLEGSLALDAAYHPAGRLDAEIANPALFVAMLKKARLLAPDAADSLGAALTLAAIAGGGKVAAPLDLENGTASIAGATITKLPRLGE